MQLSQNKYKTKFVVPEKMKTSRPNLILTTLLLFVIFLGHAHPTGNMITVGEAVLWSYINPIDDSNHYACVMIKKKNAKPKVFIQSEHAASDYMLFNNKNEIYIIERKYSQATDAFEVRVLKTTIEKEPEVIWDWFKDDHRIGEGGFFMRSDNVMVFGKYPEIFRLEKGKTPVRYFNFNYPIKRIRAVHNNQILLMGDESCHLVTHDGTIVKQWHKLIDKDIQNAPLNRNQLFDADYHDGELLLSYWGKRTFDLIDLSGKRKIILQQAEPLTPHWVAFFNTSKLLFSSKLTFDGKTPRPNLILLDEKNIKTVIWDVQ